MPPKPTNEGNPYFPGPPPANAPYNEVLQIISKPFASQVNAHGETRTQETAEHTGPNAESTVEPGEPH